MEMELELKWSGKGNWKIGKLKWVGGNEAVDKLKWIVD